MKLRYLVYLVLSLFFVACGSKKNIRKQKKKSDTVKVEPKPITLPSVNQDKHVKKLEGKKKNLNKYTLAYIKKYAPLAVREMHLHKIPASITLAQGILESGRGRSELARKSNNHFGIKCHTGWKGKRVYHDDDAKGECFRKYDYPESSYHDHSEFLTKRRRYAFLFSYGTTNYKKWAKGLKKAGYATDKKYPVKLIRLIEDYKLYEFDKVKKKDFKYKKPDRKKDLVVKKKTTKNRVYKVQKGDTLYSISRNFGVSVKELKRLNNLKDNIISVGQILKVN